MSYKKQNLQVLVSEDFQKFIIVQKIKNNTSIITPFEKLDDNNYSSNFILPENRTYRVAQMRNLIPKISKFTSYSDFVNLDCLENIEPSIFNNIEDGLIMLNIFSKNEKIKNTDDKYENILEYDDKLLLNNCEKSYKPVEINIPNKFIFKTDDLKVLPVVLYDGFILSITDENRSILYLSIKNPEENLVGQCSKKSAFNIVNYFYNIWPIFDINIRLKATVKLFLEDDKLNLTGNKPILLKFTKDLKDEKAIVEMIGETI
jgi:hypothetical protein